jgi:hypothetical protein
MAVPSSTRSKPPPGGGSQIDAETRDLGVARRTARRRSPASKATGRTARAERCGSIPDTRDIVNNVYIRKVERIDGRLINKEFFAFHDVKDPWREFNPE